jgi:hypothetical protein
MKKLSVLAFLVVVSVVLAAVNLNDPIAELRLKDGRTLKNVVLVSFATTTVMARWDGGRGTIAHELFPEAYQETLTAMRPKQKISTAPALRATPPQTKSSQTSQAAVPTDPIPNPPGANNVRRIVGEVFIGGGESQSTRVKFAAVPVVAYPLTEALSALDTNVTPTLPPPIASAETDSEGRFELDVPADAKFLLIVKGKHRALRGGRITEWEWRIPDSDINGNRVMLHDKNAFTKPWNQTSVQR